MSAVYIVHRNGACRPAKAHSQPTCQATDLAEIVSCTAPEIANFILDKVEAAFEKNELIRERVTAESNQQWTVSVIPLTDSELCLVIRESDSHAVNHLRIAHREASEVRSRLATLTAREHEVMDRISHGKTVKQIASEFGVSGQTAAKHRARVLAKLRVENDVELVRLLISAEAG